MPTSPWFHLKNHPLVTRRSVGAGLLAAGAAALITRLPLTITGPLALWLALMAFAGLMLMVRARRAAAERFDRERRQMQLTADLHRATIEALAHAIDAKDHGNCTDIRRVQLYAGRLATAAGLTPSEVEGVRTAALLHNVGKLAVPEHVLSKSGLLTPEEFQTLRLHPQIGAEIVAGVPFPYAVAPIIMSQRERWDGLGYPQGLAAEKIPIGARILTIVSYYDAIMTERPGRKAISLHTAVGLLRHECGRALDPRLVEIFIGLLPLPSDNVELSEASGAVEVSRIGSSDAAVNPELPTDVLAGQPTMRQAIQNIALANRQQHALFEQAQADSLTDPLTTLPNRRSLFVHLARELARAGRLSSDIALVLLDLDSFKRVNDSFGHLVGDRAISAAGAALKGALRPYDLCVRYGGDEFVIVLGECSRDLAETKRRELQSRIGEIEIDVGNAAPIRLSASAGVASFPEDGTTAEALIARADAQMYIDKSERHSRAAVAPPRPDRRSIAG